MKYQNFPGTDLKVSEIALGTWVFGGDAYGQANENECIDAVKAAIDCGITLIDTAPIYGHGRSEEIIGRAIASKREKVIIATKCGLRLNKSNRIDHDLSTKSIKEEIEGSLKRLNTDYIDLYQCHWPDKNTPIEETLKTLKVLKDSGKIRYIGISNFPLDLLKVVAEEECVISLQSQYSLLERELEEGIFSFIEDNKIGLLAYGVLGGGILTGKYKNQPQLPKGDARSFFYRFYKDENFVKVQELLGYFKELNRPFNEIALNWVRQNSVTTSVLVGCRNQDQVEQNVKAVEWDLSEDEMNRLNKFKFKL